MTDLICEGRLDIGIAAAPIPASTERLLPGLDAWSAGQRMRELIPAVKGSGAVITPTTASSSSFRPRPRHPKPQQKPHPPIWVAARDPTRTSLPLRNGCNVQVTPLWQDDEEFGA
ncbi:LLM class flavin-dependent oxidoreductase (plasmid) [Sinorhizobium meliloti]|nr:LLM class flavin-dependent oxidoreductase [Sinorhizobium meliloti]